MSGETKTNRRSESGRGRGDALDERRLNLALSKGTATIQPGEKYQTAKLMSNPLPVFSRAQVENVAPIAGVFEPTEYYEPTPCEKRCRAKCAAGAGGRRKTRKRKTKRKRRKNKTNKKTRKPRRKSRKRRRKRKTKRKFRNQRGCKR